jgi:HD-GYP domain-containing protein (c-di-GMP phosphodiesterase class II)
MQNYNFNCGTVIKYLRKVLEEINRNNINSGIKTAFVMKRYIEEYKIDRVEFKEHEETFDDDKLRIKKIPKNEAIGQKLVLLCMLKDIGTFYRDMEVPVENHKLAAATSYAFLSECSPIGDAARPLLFYKAKYIEEENKESRNDYRFGLLMTLINEFIMYTYQDYSLTEIEDLIKHDKRGYFYPDQVKKLFKLLKKEPQIYEWITSPSKESLYTSEVSNYINYAKFDDEYLEGFINLATFSFEFHNHETLAHTVTVAKIGADLAKLSRLPDSMVEEVRIAGLIHDIGKIRVPVEVLCFPGRLEGDMLKEMQNHAKYTHEIIDKCFSYRIVNIASHHHEKLDGTGYPEHLTARNLTIGDKVIAVADIASALYCKRSYKEAFSDEKIMSILWSDANAGKLEKHIVQHLEDHYDEIMANAKDEESKVLNCYSAMKAVAKAYSELGDLDKFFDSDDISKDVISMSEDERRALKEEKDQAILEINAQKREEQKAKFQFTEKKSIEEFVVKAKLRDTDEEKLYIDKFDTRETEEEIEEEASKTAIKYDDPNAIEPTENTNYKSGSVDFENKQYDYAKDLSEDVKVEVKPVSIPDDSFEDEEEDSDEDDVLVAKKMTPFGNNYEEDSKDSEEESNEDEDSNEEDALESNDSKQEEDEDPFDNILEPIKINLNTKSDENDDSSSDDLDDIETFDDAIEELNQE